MINEWFRLSKHDSDTVNYLYKNMPSAPVEIVCYHCQQAAEKLLKGLLTAKEIQFDKKHDLTYLFDLLDYKEKDATVVFEACARLTPYGVSVRYPGAKEISKEEMALAVSDMNKVGSFVRKEILKIQNFEKTNQKNQAQSRDDDFSPTR